MTHHRNRPAPLAQAASCALVALVAIGAPCGSALAQAQPPQKVLPPEAQAWIDLATYSGFGMPGMGGGGPEAPSAMAMLGGLLGSATGMNTNRFGHTRSGLAGRWMDVTVASRKQALNEVTLTLPAGAGLSPALSLKPPKAAPPAPPEEEREVEPIDQEKPKGKVSLYWGCGETVRPGQPRTVDFASALPQDLAQIFTGRRATQRGAHSAAGRPLWPNEGDARMVPREATLAGEMNVAGAGLPENFRFTLPPQQDLMPPLELQQADSGNATQLAWGSLPTARGYFAAAMGGRKGDEAHMVLWVSSELPDSGLGLVDYQTNASVDRWLKDKVLLPAGTTRCAIPKEVFGGEGAMLRLIAYGNELNLAYPPRPTDPRVTWAPQWAVKVRVKSVASTVLGMEGGARPAEARPEGERPPSAIDRLRGLFGR